MVEHSSGSAVLEKDQSILSLEQAAISRDNKSNIKKKITHSRRSRHKKQGSKRRLVIISSSISVLLICCYLLIAFSSIPFIVYWRNIWIETAMTTGRHHWLATAFFPEAAIEEVMAGYKTNSEVVGGNDALNIVDVLMNEDDIAAAANTKKRLDDILDQKNLKVGDKDYAGNKILVNDIDEGITISEIIGTNFRGQIMLIDDPSRVFLGQTQYQNDTGMRILDMMEVYGAIAGINASGFNDADGNGNGGAIVGLSCSQGNYWGNYLSGYSSIVLTTDDQLVVGNIGDWGKYNIRDGIQFYPVLIADGVQQVTGSAGYGLQPRTAVAQREDGVIAFLIIDGRDVTWSVGCTVGDMAEILMKYNMKNASCCDGGASSCLAYNGKITTKNCSWNPSIGRILPNAFMVKSKKDA